MTAPQCRSDFHCDGCATAGVDAKQPHARSRHTLCNGHIVGGFGANDAILRSHLVLDPLHPLEGDVQAVAVAQYPLMRAGHACCALPDGRNAVVGGFVGDKRRLANDVFVF